MINYDNATEQEVADYLLYEGKSKMVQDDLGGSKEND